MITAALFGLGAVLSVVAQLTLSRVMSPVAYGDFALLYATGMVLSGFGALGHDMAALRFMASTGPSGASPVQRAFFWMALRKTALGAGLLAMFAPPVCVAAGLLPASQALALFLLIPSWACLRLVASVLRTENRSSASIALDRIARDGSLFILATILLLVAGRSDDQWPAIVLICATALSVLIGAAMLKPLLRWSPGHAATAQEKALWGRTSRRLLAINGLELVGGRFDLFFLAFVVDKAIVGQMNIVIVLSTIAILPSVFTGFLLMPRVAAATAEGRHDDVDRDIVACTWLNGVLAILASTAVIGSLLAFRDWPAFDAVKDISMSVIAWMFAARCVTSWTMASLARLQMVGKERVVIAAHIASLLLKAVLYLLWSDMTGLLPAVIICFASAVLFALVIYLASRFAKAFPLYRKS